METIIADFYQKVIYSEIDNISSTIKRYKEEREINITGTLIIDRPIVYEAKEGSKFETLEIENIARLTLHNSEIGTLFIKGNNLKSIDLNNCKINRLKIEAIEIKNHSINTVASNVLILDELDNCSIDILEISGKRINADRLKANKKIKISRCNYLGFKKIETKQVEYDRLYFFSDKQDWEITKDEINAEELYIRNSTFKNLIFKNISLNKVYVERSNADLLKLKGVSGDFNFQDCSISSVVGVENSLSEELNLNINKLIKCEKIDLSNSNFNNLSFLNLNLSSGIILNKIFVSNNFRLENSIIATGYFNSVALQNTKEINFDNTSLIDSTFNNVLWPNNHKLRGEKEIVKVDTKNNYDSESEDLLLLKESYRQLKHVYLKQDNRIDANLFKNHELSVFKKIQRLNRKVATKFSDKVNALFDEAIIWTYKNFGGFGLHLKYPLIWLLSLHTILFILLYIYDKSYSFNLFDFRLISNVSDITFKATLDGFGTYLYFLNPVHPFRYNGVYLQNAIDILMRLSSGYFIFYILRVTRKFH